ncbi:MAG TPA: cobyric acid synthase [Chloroflexota bacterium]|nr:cobyric acid synthase [Chloroflexota bacterium]
MMAEPAAVLMVQGTASHVGKSTLVTALCRIFRQDGLRVAPFKAQNMALNSFVAIEGGEIGRAQAVQAEAAGVEPSVDMNPILLKPEGEARSQVVLEGRASGSLGAADYHRAHERFWPVVEAALARLRSRFDLVVIEGAGSPAEVNLRSTDLANMRVALHAGAPVLLVGDIERGGVFASLLGTLELLQPQERSLVCGLAINKFRGDLSILLPGLELLEQRTGVPVLGVLPFLPHLDLPEEDSLGLDGSRGTTEGPGLDLAVARLPRIANFDDFSPLAAEPSVRLRYVDDSLRLGRPDLLFMPGTKTTVADLAWLRQTGLADATVRLRETGTPVVGICGGLQMLGQRILDPHGAESPVPETAGLGLLPVETSFATVKRTCRVRGRVATRRGPLGSACGGELAGYEIHMGQTTIGGQLERLFAIHERSGQTVDDSDGLFSPDGLVLGTYLHGLFENPPIRAALLGWLSARTGRAPAPVAAPIDRERQYDALADAVRHSLDIARLKSACNLA